MKGHIAQCNVTIKTSVYRITNGEIDAFERDFQALFNACERGEHLSPAIMTRPAHRQGGAAAGRKSWLKTAGKPCIMAVSHYKGVTAMGKTARLVLKLVAAGLAFCALVCLIVGSWCDVGEAIDRRKKQRLAMDEYSDYADEELRR